MNRGEAMGLGIFLSSLTIIWYYAILYFLVFDNFLIVAKTLNHDLYSVEEEIWWMFIGFGLILAVRAATKSYKWARRSYCDHCGKEIKK